MASVNGSSMSSALGITGKGIGGLATGLNTDDIVAALTSGTQSKIAKQGQQKQLLNWKMNAYRTMTSALNAFQTKFLKISTSSSSNTNITASKFFNTYKATSSSTAVTASATSGAVTGNFTINKVTQLAPSDAFTSLNKMTTSLATSIKEGESLTGNFSGKTLKLEVDRFSTKSINLEGLNRYLTDNGDGTYRIGRDAVLDTDGETVLEPELTFEDFRRELERTINEAYGSNGLVSVTKDDATGKLVLDSTSAKITVNTKNDFLGLDAGKSNRVSTKTTIGELDAFANVQGEVLTFNINGTEISVNKRDSISTLMSKVTNSGANVTMAYDQNKDRFTLTSKLYGADSKIEMKDVQGNLLNEIFGAQSGNSIGTDLLTRSDSIAFNNVNRIDTMSEAQKKSYVSELSRMSFDLTINGVTKTVKLDLSMGIGSAKLNAGTYTSDDVYNAINKGIQNAFYGSGVEFSQTVANPQTGEIGGRTVISTSQNEAFAISARGEFAAALGISPTGAAVEKAGNTIYDYGYNNKIKSFDDAGFIDVTDENFTGNTFEMTINGVKKTITVTPAMNGDEEIPLTNANFLSRLNAAIKEQFGSDAAGVSFSADYEKEPVYQKYTAEALNGFTVNNDTDENVAGYYKDGVRVADKDGNVLRDGNKVVVSQNITGVKLTLNVPANAVGVTETSVSMSGALVEMFNFATSGTVASNTNTLSSTPATFGMLNGGADMAGGTLTLANGATVSYTAGTKIQDFLKELNQKLGDSGSAGIKDGKLYIKSSSDSFKITETGSGNMLEKIFGINSKNASNQTEFATTAQSYTTGANGNYKEYKNAKYEIDGVEYTASSNNISHNGVTLTLNQTSDVAIQIGVQADPDDVITRIKEWMDDYNALVYTLNSAINEGKNRDYSPLTDEQKAEMTDDQIKTWEAEAKKGILRSDQTLRQILADMRSALYQKVESAGISLYDIGIVTKSGLSDPNQAGQLEFDTNITGGGEDRLRNMLLNNPDKVRTLFTDAQNGIGAKLNNIITQAASTSSVNRGTLVRIAGTEQLTGDNTSQLGTKISALDKYIATLKTRLETQYNRYWKQFSTLETSVQKMNSQSSWLQSQ